MNDLERLEDFLTEIVKTKCGIRRKILAIQNYINSLIIKKSEKNFIYVNANDETGSGRIEITYDFNSPKEFLLTFKRENKKTFIALDKQNAKELVSFIVSKL